MNSKPIVIGAGLGGLLAAALLVRRGQRPIVLEKLNFVGGRFTQFEYEGFSVPTGAFHSLPTGPHGPLGRIFARLGLPLKYFAPVPATFMYDGEKRWSLPLPPQCAFRRDSYLRRLRFRDRVRLARMWRRIKKGDAQELPDSSMGEFARGFCAAPAFLAALEASMRYAEGVGADAACARDVARAIRLSGGNIGSVIIGGCRQVVEQLEKLISEGGGEIKINCGASRIEIADGAAATVIDEAGKEYRASLVVSNAPPADTAQLLGAECPPALIELAARLAPAYGIAHSIRSEQPLSPYAGVDFPLGFGGVIAGCNHVSNCDPSLAAPGQDYTLAYQIMTAGQNPAEAVALGRAELKRMYPGLSDSNFFHTSIYQKSWPTAYVAQQLGQHGHRRVPLCLPEIRDFYMLSHSSVGTGIAGEIIGDAAAEFDSLLGEEEKK